MHGSRFSIGVSLKEVHLQDIFNAPPPWIDFFEIHTENYLPFYGEEEKILSLNKLYPLSLHCLGLSPGSWDPVPRETLELTKEMLSALNVLFISEHLAWSRHNNMYFFDLLPLPYTDESLNRMADHVSSIQDYLGHRILIENPSVYATPSKLHTYEEYVFLQKLVEKTNCGLLLDINNVYVSSYNLKYDPYTYLRNIPESVVEEIHLSGHRKEKTIIIDDHGGSISDSVLELYQFFLNLKTNHVATLVEWDNNLQSFDDLLQEARKVMDLLPPDLPMQSLHTIPHHIRSSSHEKTKDLSLQTYYTQCVQYLQSADLHATLEEIFPESQHLMIYRRNIIHSLSHAIQHFFPIFTQLIGTDCLESLMNHWKNSELLPESPITDHLTHAFINFLNKRNPFQNTPFLYLYDIARLEAALQQATWYRPAVSSNTPLQINPSLHIIASDYPVVTIYKHQTEMPSEPLDISQKSGETAGVCRYRNIVKLYSFDHEMTRFLSNFPNAQHGDNNNFMDIAKESGLIIQYGEY